ncbi:hypothetical protein GC194_04595 [bacterium]|nr:hypothetical protein [bacterium]
MAIHLLGIRHHGPGSARQLVHKLNALKPDVLLIEGPPEAEDMLQWVQHIEMKPPVALLAYDPNEPKNATFYPFTNYSPEWQAILYGLENQIPIRFIDMPLAHKLAENLTENELLENIENESITYKSPMQYLAEAAGFDNEEEWWEQHFELSSQSNEHFEAIEEAFTSLREALDLPESLNEQRREAFMRQAIRQAEKEMFHSIAVVCGAFHVPALKKKVTVKHDNDLTKKLPKTKIECTWIPWTNDRLSYYSGYGAGVNSPGYYENCWQNPGDDGSIWLSKAAAIFRKHQIDIASSHVIESVRLAQTLAALRQKPKPGLHELNEATQTVMCMGDEVQMRIVWRDLIVGNTYGEVPADAPQVPIQKDLELKAKKLRIKITEEPKTLKLDLRDETHREKSVLIHQVAVLGIQWAQQSFVGGKGTFKEQWELMWRPDQTLQLLDKAIWGNTIEMAANAFLISKANESAKLDEITTLLETALPADLHQGIEALMRKMDSLASTTTDSKVLMKAILPLIQIKRYGNVRQTDLEVVGEIVDTIFNRITAALPMSCTGIDQEQAAEMAQVLKDMQQGVLLLDDSAMLQDWMQTLLAVADNEKAAALLHGTSCKLLYDQQFITGNETAKRFSRALSIGTEAAHAAAWIEGFLKDAAMVLLLDDEIWEIINEWISSLEDDGFNDTIPLLRRTFASFSASEKQKIAEKAKHGTKRLKQTLSEENLNHERAQKLLPTLRWMVGLPPSEFSQVEVLEQNDN